MKSKKPGKNIFKAEVAGITPKGIWILVQDREYFLSYKDFPWFEKASVNQIQNLKLLHGHHLYWKDLDIDLELDSLQHLESYPLKYVA